jgi:hypothetical protein
LKNGRYKLQIGRIDEKVYQNALEMENVIPMEYTGKAIKGYVFVTENGHISAKDLDYWLELCLEFNPRAKASRKWSIPNSTFECHATVNRPHSET